MSLKSNDHIIDLPESDGQTIYWMYQHTHLIGTFGWNLSRLNEQNVINKNWESVIKWWQDEYSLFVERREIEFD